MFIKQRNVRRSRFESRFARASQKRREYVATLYTTAVIQFFLVLFLFIGAWRALVMMRDKFPDVVWYFKYFIPFAMALIGAFVLRLLAANVVRGVRADETEPRPKS